MIQPVLIENTFKEVVKRIIIILIKLIFTFHLLVAQNDKYLDSLEDVVSVTKNDSIKFNALDEIIQSTMLSRPNWALIKAMDLMNVAKKMNLPVYIGKAYNRLGDTYWYTGDLGNSATNYFNALPIFEKLKDQVGIADCYRNIGWIYNDQKNFKKALEYHRKALQINRDNSREIMIAKNYNDIGIIFIRMGEFDQAHRTFQLGIKEMDKLKISNGSIAINGLCVLYGNLSDLFLKVGKKKEALESTRKSIVFAEQLNNERYKSFGYMNLGDIYFEDNKLDLALQAFIKAKKFFEKDKEFYYLQNIVSKISDIYSKKHDFSKAFEFQKKATSLKDSVFANENQAISIETTAKHELATKELLINNLEKEQSLSEEKLKREKNFKIYLSLFLFFVVGFAFVLFRSNLQRKKANEALSIAYSEIEKKNKDITDSIKYAQTIQRAILPTANHRLRIVNKSFILYKPKDIVSGDFYWFAEKNGKKIIAACDCTGHGVPGALMSMLGNNILNQIVNEKGITNPGEILTHLNKKIRETLKQDEQNEARDGMDVALVTIESKSDLNALQLEFSGAQRPIWIVEPLHNISANIEAQNVKVTKSEKFQLIEIKGNKLSIGGADDYVYKNEFVYHSMLISADAVIYLFSDGFADQFSDTEKKLMSSRFKETLLGIQHLALTEQEKYLDNFIEKWKGNREQVDDILVIGLKGDLKSTA